MSEEKRTPQIKICGLPDADQALACAEYGADAIGCVFFPKSPRHLEDDAARDICRALPEHVAGVGVFVGESYDFVMKKVDYCGLKAVQLHALETPEMVKRIRENGIIVIKGLFASREPKLEKAPRFDPDAFLVECGKGKLPGGNAEQWDWGSVKPFGDAYPLVLAGGLAPENIAAAIADAQPDAVDISSGVEASPGIKDLERVKTFIENVRTTPLNRIPRRIF